MEEGTILRWIKSPGDDVAVGDELVEIETDKANMVYEADSAGTLVEIVAQEGDTLPIGEVIARIGAAGDAPSGNGAGATGASSPEAELPETSGATSGESESGEPPSRRRPHPRPSPRPRQRRPRPRTCRPRPLRRAPATGGSRRRPSPSGWPRREGLTLLRLPDPDLAGGSLRLMLSGPGLGPQRLRLPLLRRRLWLHQPQPLRVHRRSRRPPRGRHLLLS